VAYTSTLEMEAANSSEALVNVYRAQHHIHEVSNLDMNDISGAHK
jgi:hypothetical protein